MVSGKTRWFRERLCGFRLGGCFKKWFQERFGGVRKVWGVSRKSCVVSGKAAWFQERLRGFRREGVFERVFWLVFERVFCF